MQTKVFHLLSGVTWEWPGRAWLCHIHLKQKKTWEEEEEIGVATPILNGKPVEGTGWPTWVSGFGLPPPGAMDPRGHCRGNVDSRECVHGLHVWLSPQVCRGLLVAQKLSYTWCESHSESGCQHHSGCRISHDPMKTNTVPAVGAISFQATFLEARTSDGPHMWSSANRGSDSAPKQRNLDWAHVKPHLALLPCQNSPRHRWGA